MLFRTVFCGHERWKTPTSNTKYYTKIISFVATINVSSQFYRHSLAFIPISLHNTAVFKASYLGACIGSSAVKTWPRGPQEWPTWAEIRRGVWDSINRCCSEITWVYAYPKIQRLSLSCPCETVPGPEQKFPNSQFVEKLHHFGEVYDYRILS